MFSRLASLFILLSFATVVHADGCKFRTDGRLVPEREQRAFIEWENGVETLHVAARADLTTEGTVWIVPIRASAKSVRAEPVECFPAVAYYETLKNRAERQMKEMIAVTQLLNSGGFFCLPALGCGGAEPHKAAVEESRIEKLGMVVVVLSAESRGALEVYLDAQGVNRVAADLSSLEPYLGNSEFALVCGWVTRRDKPAAATAIRVVFTSPNLWFPLQPTRAYTNAVETVVYVRGFVKPAPGCDVPGLKCQYIYGAVKELGVSQAFAQDSAFHEHGQYTGQLEPLTRITLADDPQKWDRDLELMRGTTAVGMVALGVAESSSWIQLFSSSALGALLGLFIPWLTIPKTRRLRTDWLAGALTGAAIVLSIWASLLVFGIWRSRRFADRPRQPSRWLVVPALAIVHFAIVLGVCRALLAWISSAA